MRRLQVTFCRTLKDELYTHKCRLRTYSGKSRKMSMRLISYTISNVHDNPISNCLRIRSFKLNVLNFIYAVIYIIQNKFHIYLVYAFRFGCQLHLYKFQKGVDKSREPCNNIIPKRKWNCIFKWIKITNTWVKCL